MSTTITSIAISARGRIAACDAAASDADFFLEQRRPWLARDRLRRLGFVIKPARIRGVAAPFAQRRDAQPAPPAPLLERDPIADPDRLMRLERRDSGDRDAALDAQACRRRTRARQACEPEEFVEPQGRHAAAASGQGWAPSAWRTDYRRFHQAPSAGGRAVDDAP